MDYWCSDRCPDCNKLNFVNTGDLNDTTARDVIGIECWKCGKEWKFEGIEGIEEDIKYFDNYFEKGRNFEEVKLK